MKVYISGISGTGLGPLALMAKAAGCEVFGSDLNAGAILPELENAGIEVEIGPQTGDFLREKLETGLDWFVYTSALPENHPELMLAKEQGLKTTKRDDFTAYLIEKLGLKLVAVAGTHGKTTTTSMLVFAALKLNLPISYLVGTTLGFAPSGAYNPDAKYFIYEADEYDRNFLKFSPWLSVITAIDYDHPDIYPTPEAYRAAFSQFLAQSENVILLSTVISSERSESRNPFCDSPQFSRRPLQVEKSFSAPFSLPGPVRRMDAALAASALEFILKAEHLPTSDAEIVEILNNFPGVGRRFERLTDGVYSDYAHHPNEVKSTLEIALEEAKNRNKKGVVLLYEPHQNSRQHEVQSAYHDAFLGAEHLFWLPTFLTRENPNLEVLTPSDFIATLDNREIAEPAELTPEFAEKLRHLQKENYLILLMTAGPADAWLRKVFL